MHVKTRQVRLNVSIDFTARVRMLYSDLNWFYIVFLLNRNISRREQRGYSQTTKYIMRNN